MKLSNVLDVVRKELVARVRSVEDSATYGVTEIPKTERSSSSEFQNLVVS